MRSEVACGVFALVGAIVLQHGMSQEHIVVCGDGPALGFGFFCQRMVVDGHVLIFICLDNHDHRQVSNQQRKQGGEHDHGAGKALAQGNAS